VCGLAGILLKEPGALGDDLVTLGKAIRHRGFDSTGFALYDAPTNHASLDVHTRGEATTAVLTSLEHTDGVHRVSDARVRGSDHFFRVELDADEPFPRIAAHIGDLGGFVHAAGYSLRVIKDLGDAETVAATHGVAAFGGTHGLVHNRLATESIVDVDYSHPFWASPFADVCVIHHGHITNYDRLRRVMIGEGQRFLTGNDSELAAVWLARRIQQGATLDEALREASATLDGIYLLLVGTRDGIGAVRDKYGACPLVIAEDDHCIAFGSELQALLDVVSPDAPIRNLPEEGVISWDARSIVTA
jgi:methylamine---glutamate N-methyltransferase subunit A